VKRHVYPRTVVGKVEVITSNILRCYHDLVDRCGISFTNDHRYVPLVVNTSWSFPHSRLITGFVTGLTRRVPPVGQELLTLPEHLNSPPVFSGVHVTRSLVLFVCFVIIMAFSTFFLAIAVSVLLRYKDSDCPFSIFKLFLSELAV